MHGRGLVRAGALAVATAAAGLPFDIKAANLVFHRYDPVAFFAAARPVSGNRRFRHSCGRGNWRFTSAANRDAFAAAMADGRPAAASRVAWTLREGRLFLNCDGDVRARRLKDVGGEIRRADAAWAADVAAC